MFGRKKSGRSPLPLPGEPVIRASICTGEQTAGFLLEDGRFVDVQLIRTEADLAAFREQYGIQEKELRKIY